MSAPYLSIVIPAYNEEENFRRGVLEKVSTYLEKRPFSWEVIFVDDGSVDSTLRLLSNFVKKHPGFYLIESDHGGKFKAVAKGVYEAKGEVVLFSDFDQSTPISEFEKFQKEFQKGSDVIIGNRVAGERINDPLYRYVRSRMFNLLVRVIILPGISDTQCGFKAFKGQVGKKLFSSLLVAKEEHVGGSFMGGFDVELLYLARKMGYKISEVPVKWAYAKSSRLSFWHPLRIFLDILKIRAFDFLGKYKK